MTEQNKMSDKKTAEEKSGLQATVEKLTEMFKSEMGTTEREYKIMIALAEYASDNTKEYIKENNLVPSAVEKETVTDEMIEKEAQEIWSLPNDNSSIARGAFSIGMKRFRDKYCPAVKEGWVNERLKVAIEALKEIINPIKAMREQLKDGEVLDGINAVLLSKDSYYLQSIAEKALKEILPAPPLVKEEKHG